MLCNIPPEIVSEIASHLPYRDIVTLRQVFTHADLRNATDAHVVWLNLAKQYVTENPHSHFSNIQSISSLTTDQIRERFEKRLLVDHLWQSPGKVYPTMKRLKKPSPRIITVGIAPGGRWLFAGTDYCSLYYWDLESDDPEPVHLVPCDDDVDNTPGEGYTITAIDFLVERGDPLSGFIIAFIGRDFHREHEESGEWLYIWDVIPQENETLKAKRLRTLPLPYHGLTSRLSFNGHLVARTMAQRLDVYWWRDCTETQLVRCTLVLGADPIITSVYVIGSDKLLVYTRHRDQHKAQLYALEPEYSDVSETGKAVSHATEIWSFRFCSEYKGYKISRLYFDGASYRQIIAMFDGIYGLTISALQADDAEATLTKVSNFDLHQRQSDARLYGLGLNKGCCRVGTELYRFGYSNALTSGSYEHGVMFEAGIDPFLRRLDYVLSFDEELGRLISVKCGHLVIQDFSLPVYNPADVCPGSDAWTSSRCW